MSAPAKVVALLAFIAVGVAINVGVEHLAERRAQRVMVCAVGEAWNCPADSIQVAALGAATYQFAGCGREATYSCKLPGEGCLLKGNKAETLQLGACDK